MDTFYDRLVNLINSTRPITMQKVGLLIRRPRQSIRTFVNNRRPEIYVSAWGSRAFCGDEELLKFQRSFKKNLQNCTWKPHPKYSVFTQYDLLVSLQQLPFDDSRKAGVKRCNEEDQSCRRYYPSSQSIPSP